MEKNETHQREETEKREREHWVKTWGREEEEMRREEERGEEEKKKELMPEKKEK